MSLYPGICQISGVEPGKLFLAADRESEIIPLWIGATLNHLTVVVCVSPLDDLFMDIAELGGMHFGVVVDAKPEIAFNPVEATQPEEADPPGTLYIGPRRCAILCQISRQRVGLLNVATWQITEINVVPPGQVAAIHAWRLQLPPTATRPALVLAEYNATASGLKK